MTTMLRMFISYAHEDEAYKEAMLKHLSGMEKEISIDIWHDRRIPPGGEWAAEIETAIRSADLALLLISADFMASRFIKDNELRLLLERAADDGIRVVPLIVRNCDWQALGFGRLQALPRDGHPVAEAEFPDREWAAIARQIRQWCIEHDASDAPDGLTEQGGARTHVPTTRPDGERSRFRGWGHIAIVAVVVAVALSGVFKLLFSEVSLEAVSGLIVIASILIAIIVAMASAWFRKRGPTR